MKFLGKFNNVLHPMAAKYLPTLRVSKVRTQAIIFPFLISVRPHEQKIESDRRSVDVLSLSNLVTINECRNTSL